MNISASNEVLFNTIWLLLINEIQPFLLWLNSLMGKQLWLPSSQLSLINNALIWNSWNIKNILFCLNFAKGRFLIIFSVFFEQISSSLSSICFCFFYQYFDPVIDTWRRLGSAQPKCCEKKDKEISVKKSTNFTVSLAEFVLADCIQGYNWYHTQWSFWSPISFKKHWTEHTQILHLTGGWWMMHRYS